MARNILQHCDRVDKMASYYVHKMATMADGNQLTSIQFTLSNQNVYLVYFVFHNFRVGEGLV